MKKKRKPSAPPNVRGQAQGRTAAASVSSAWERLKAQPVTPVVPEEQVHRTEAGPGLWRREIIPGKCTCDKERVEDNGVRRVVPQPDGSLKVERGTPDPNGIRINPWVFGHATWCSMWVVKCEYCGLSCGTHARDCQFWQLHPNVAPF